MIQLGAIMIRWDAFLPMNVQAKSSVQLFKLNRAYIYNAQPYLTLPTYLPMMQEIKHFLGKVVQTTAYKCFDAFKYLD